MVSLVYLGRNNWKAVTDWKLGAQWIRSGFTYWTQRMQIRENTPWSYLMGTTLANCQLTCLDKVSWVKHHRHRNEIYLSCFPRFLQITGSDSSLLYLSWSRSSMTARYEIGLRRTVNCPRKSEETWGEKCAAEKTEALREPCCHSVRHSWGKDEWDGSCSWDVSDSSIGQQSLQVVS